MSQIQALQCKILTASLFILLIISILIIYATDLQQKNRASNESNFTSFYHNWSSNLPDNHNFLPKMMKDHIKQESKRLLNSTVNNFGSNGTEAVCVYGKTCILSCSGGTIDEVVNSINKLVREGSTCSLKENLILIIKETAFASNSITFGWLQEVTSNVQHLEMSSVSIEETGEAIFSGKPFGTSKNLITITFSNTVITTLKRSMFLGSFISSLEIYFDELLSGVNIEEGVLTEISSSIGTISFKRCLSDGDALKNLTGRGNILSNLQTVDVSYNLIPTLKNGTFLRAPNIRQLYLVSSAISEIENGAFQGLDQLIQLQLGENNLKTLPEGLFDDFRSLVSFYYSGNPWNCDCNLQWFKDYLNSLPSVDYKNCKVDYEWVDMEDIEFCPKNSTSISTSEATTARNITTSTEPYTAKSTTVSSTVITNAPDEAFTFEKIRCRSLLSYSPYDFEKGEKIVWYVSMFKRRNIKYTLSENTYNSTFFLELSTAIKPKDFLIWTNVNNRSDYGCVFNINSIVSMELQYEETYTLCFSSNDTTDTYALIADDCTAIATPQVWARRAWIRNNHKTDVVLVTIFTFIVTTIIASGAVYYLIKCNPELIKGNKRILIVKRGKYSPNILVMPSKKNRLVSVSTDKDGYLIPKRKLWPMNSKLDDMRSEELQTITDNNSVMEEDFCEDVIEKDMYEPPPLPPDHPTRRRDSGKPYFYSNM